jgi:hypothetical protein
MFGRVVRLEVEPEKVDPGIEWIKSTAIPRAQAQAGFERGYWFFDRPTGKAAVVTLWDGEDSLKASAQMAADLREESIKVLGTGVLTIEEYELAAEA